MAIRLAQAVKILSEAPSLSAFSDLMGRAYDTNIDGDLFALLMCRPPVAIRIMRSSNR
jgi:hypothetical protein